MCKKKQVKNGESIEEAIIINAKNEIEGIMAEYAYLEKNFGACERDWELNMQSRIKEGGKVYDRMDLKLSDGTQKMIYFEVTSFFGKL